MSDRGDDGLGLVERAVLRIWRWLPRRARERHASDIVATLSEMSEETRRAQPSAGENSGAGIDRGDAAGPLGFESSPDPEGGRSVRDATERRSVGRRRSMGRGRILVDALVTLGRACIHELHDTFRGKTTGGEGLLDPRRQVKPRGGRQRALERIAQDVLHSARMLRRAPGFATVAILTLALGIGGATTIFSLVNAVLLRPLPYPEADRLVELGEYRLEYGLPEGGSPGSGLPYPTLEEMQRLTGVFVDVGGVAWTSAVLLGGDEPVYLRAGIADPQLFRTLGMPAAVGRTLQSGDSDVVVLGNALWRRSFGADPAVIGRTVRLGRASYVIVGVMPADFLPEGLPEFAGASD